MDCNKLILVEHFLVITIPAIGQYCVDYWSKQKWIKFLYSIKKDFHMKRSFFQAEVVSILLYGWTTWTLTKRLEKKLDGSYTRMLRAILNMSWLQHPTKHQLNGQLPLIRVVATDRVLSMGQIALSRVLLLICIVLVEMFWRLNWVFILNWNFKNRTAHMNEYRFGIK